MHDCTICYATMDEHDGDCPIDGCEGHWPPLCCLGCGCESFEDAHPGYVAVCACGAAVRTRFDRGFDYRFVHAASGESACTDGGFAIERRVASVAKDRLRPLDRVYRWVDVGTGVDLQTLTVVRVNRKTVTVRTDAGSQFRLPPQDIVGRADWEAAA